MSFESSLSSNKCAILAILSLFFGSYFCGESLVFYSFTHLDELTGGGFWFNYKVGISNLVVSIGKLTTGLVSEGFLLPTAL